MLGKLAILAGLFTLCLADKDDKKWVWNGNRRDSNARSGLSIENPNSRYNVFEETDDYRPIGSTPYYPNQQVPISQGPTPVYQSRPPVYQSRPPVSGVPGQRPGGIYNNGPPPTYGSQSFYPEGESPGILTGPVPSWVKEGPIKDFDKCKCAEKFNCNTPGISYGHCDVGKQYCCYSTKKQIGGPLPTKPVHSIENGILVGPGGPTDPIPGVNVYPRPPKQIGAGYYRPGGSFYGGRPSEYGGTGPNEYSAANGILVGPGGPYDIPSSEFGLGRSAKSNIKAESKTK